MKLQYGEVDVSQIDNYQILEKAYSLLYREKSELNSGLQYARMIQSGILPKDRHINRIFKDYFVLHKQKDVIGGDFYWVGQAKEVSFIAVGDCAGHGVPGALLSMLGQSLLNYYILGKGLRDVSEILTELDYRLEETFLTNAGDEYTSDWISLSICSINKAEGIISFAGAGQSMFINTNGVISLLKGNRNPLGHKLFGKTYFQIYNIAAECIDSCYLYTDGITDQLGGPKDKRLTKSKFELQLKAISHLSLKNQCYSLSQFLLEWQGTEEQTDDLTLIGFKP